MFAIRTLSQSVPLGEGELVVGNFSERFEMLFEDWSARDYEKQWLAALTAVLSTAPRAALVASAPRVQTANYVMLWPVYREQDVIYVQQQVLLLENIRSEFSYEHVDRFIDERETIDENGDLVSEWKTSVQAVQEFCDLLGRSQLR